MGAYTFHISNPILPIKLLESNATVDELIEGESKTWKKDLVQAIFRQEEAKCICNIPISIKGMDDKVIWGLSDKGLFSVKSAYFTDLEKIKHKTGETSNSDQNERIWRKVWRLTSSGKVKQFLWKALNGIPPTRSNLFKRMVVDNSTCPICNREEETALHVLWDCPASVDVWSEEFSPVKKWRRNYADFMSVWSDFHSKLEDEKLHIIATMLHCLWRRRNDLVFEGKFKGPSVLFQLALQGVEAIKLAQEKPRESQLRTTDSLRILWRPPRLEFMKVYVDAALDTK
ncbi:uncharacterized protein LOC122310096 [Carya illinoinensis]|uniref:uncharacterized protein LOC122310096 n=1 Tax=Carya illinoinensis TaxID=32201 RepID=UPI001C727CFD|nr:uncharacterized protein LOC122310096 [Carya illinoinensis]